LIWQRRPPHDSAIVILSSKAIVRKTLPLASGLVVSGRCW
jgi:hypothetical protein